MVLVQESVDVVISDMQMPGISHRELFHGRGTHDGFLLLTADRVLDESVIERIRTFEVADAKPLSIFIRPQ